MLESLITSKTRIKLLVRFFLNPDSRSYLRELAKEFDESTNAVRMELNRLSEAGLLTSLEEGRNRFYQANPEHPLFVDIQNIVKKTLGLDQLVERVIKQLGEVKLAFLVGDYARGKDSGLIDVVLVGKVDRTSLETLVSKVEKMIKRKIRALVLTENELSVLKNSKWKEETMVLIWSSELKSQ
jgi:DNA-binding transcriptional ArsR family regulator